MGTVYEAIDSRDGGRVAVKLLHPWLAAEDSSFRDRFEREAHIAALLRSPYSVRLLDFGVAEGTYFLVMEFVEGTTVGAEIEKGVLEPVRALRIAIDVARALEEAAARGVIHRDIKPDNILLTQDGRVKVTDFGIARQEGGTGLTSAGRFVGTAEYAAPEQAVGEADHRSDIYSLGATLYCMLTGHPPFQGATVWDVLRAHQSEPLHMEPLAHLPDSIGNPIRRCMEKDPRDRYQTASELAGALERALAALLHAAQATHAPRTAPEAPPPPTHTAAPPASPAAPDAGATRVATPPGPEATRVAPPPVPEATRVGAPPPAAAAAVGVPSPGGTNIRMVVAPAGQSPGGISRFNLAVTNPSASPLRVTLSAIEPSGVLTITLPSPVMLGANETQHVPIEVRQGRPAPAGARTIQFQVTAQRDDGSRAGFVNVTVIPSAGARGGGGSGKLLLIGGAVAGVAAVVIGFVMLQGGDDKETTSTPTAGATATSPAGSGTATMTVTSAKAIEALDRWEYNFKITSNDCPFGAQAGALYPVSFKFRPASQSGTTINDGDRVGIWGIQDREISLGTFTFHFVDFEFNYPVVASGGERGTATVRTTFADSKTIGEASLTERYDAPSCTITGKLAGD